MNKKIYLIIISLITVFCILFGSAYHLSGYLFNDLFGFDFLRNDSDSENNRNKNGESRITYDENVDAFDSIRIDASVLAVTIEAGSTYHVTYDCESRLAPELKVDDGTLIIKQPDNRLPNTQSTHCELTIAVPADITLNVLEAQTDVGDIDISVVEAETASLQADVGSINIRDCSFAFTNAEADVGAITFENCTMDDGEMSADVGEIRLTDCTFSNLELSGDLGDIIVSTDSDLTDFQIDLSVDLGEIRINNESYKKSYNQRGSSGKRLEIENEIGSIHLLIPPHSQE